MVGRSCAALVAAVLLAACGSGTQTPAPATTGPTTAVTALPATAAPTPVVTPAPDVAALFAASVARLGSGSLTYTGQATVGGQATLSGSADWDASTNRTRIASMTGALDASVETLVAGGKTYLHRNDGPWVKAASGDASMLVAQLQAAAALSFTDAGTESRGGATLHRLVPASPAAFDPATVLPDSKPIQDATATLAFFADDAGAAVLATIDLVFGGSTASVEITFSALGAGKPSSAPAADDIWSVFTSSRWDASIAHPKGWTYEKGSDYDAWLSPGFPFFSFGRDAVSADADAEAKKEFNLQKSFFSGSKGTMVAAVLDGVAGHLITVTGHDSYYNANVVVYEVIAQVGKKLYWIYWESKQGNEAKDLATFEDIVSTFSFVP